MARSSLKVVAAERSPIEATQPRVVLAEANEASAPVISQPLVLQQSLLREFGEEIAVEPWSRSTRITVILGASAVLWIGLAALVQAL